MHQISCKKVEVGLLFSENEEGDYTGSFEEPLADYFGQGKHYWTWVIMNYLHGCIRVVLHHIVVIVEACIGHVNLSTIA